MSTQDPDQTPAHEPEEDALAQMEAERALGTHAAPPADDGQDDLTYGDIVWSQFIKNRVALLALGVLGFLTLLAVYAPLLASNQPFVWTTDEGTTYPWVRTLFDRNVWENPVDVFFNVLLVLGGPALLGWWARVKLAQRSGIPKRARRRQIRNEGMLIVGGIMTIFLVILLIQPSSRYIEYNSEQVRLEEAGQSVSAVFPPSPFAPRLIGFKSVEKPSATHWLGVDQSTRDVAVRLLYGTRISLTIGVIAVGIYVFIGILLGATAGYFGGRVDLAIQRLIEITMSVPTFFVILTLLAFVEERSIFHVMLVIGAVGWTGVARLVRGEFLRLRKLEFVTAAQALGFPAHRIIFQQILPNALGPVLVAAAFGVARAILVESTLSFLGLGDVTAPSWGQTIQEGYSTGAWHLILAPGFAIFVTVSVLNLVGEGLRDALDPRLRQ